MKREAAADVEIDARDDAADGRPGVQLRRARLPGVRDVEYLTGILEKNGFKIERGYAGIPTAWVATWGSGKPVIALGSDIDDIPQASQKPGVGYHDPIIEGAPGHGEGHNSGVPLNITAALAVKKIMEREHLPGTLEALARRRRGAGRRQGLFRPRRHCSTTSTSRCSRTSAANLGVELGRRLRHRPGRRSSTRSRARARTPPPQPWRGRSALDAVELMDVGWNFRREHLRLQQRSHYVITNGGDQPNVVPPNASVWYYFRETDYDAHQGAVRDRRHDGQGRGDDDRHRGDVAHPRLGVAAAHEQDRRRNDVREHQDGRPADLG